jgi:hypothetical protein
LTVSPPVASFSNNLESIKDYARSLLRSLPEKASLSVGPPRHDDETNHTQGKKQNGPTHQDRLDDIRCTDLEKEAEGGLAGCREAVEILTRNPKKGECMCHIIKVQMLNI